MRTGRFAVLAAMALSAPLFTGGTVQAADDGIYHLGEVVVSGEETGGEAIGTTHKVTAEEIKQRGVRTLDEAIDMLPGVHVRTGGDGYPRIDVRVAEIRELFAADGSLLSREEDLDGDGHFDLRLGRGKEN